MWGVKFNDSIETYCFLINNPQSNYLNPTSINGNKKLSYDDYVSISRKIEELSKFNCKNEKEKVALISDYIQSQTQYIDGYESVSSKGTFITPDFPEYIDGKQTVDDSSNDVHDKEILEGEPADKAISEPVMQKQQPSIEVTPFEQIVTPKVGIQNSASSRQDKRVQTLNRAINAIKQYGDLLRQLDQRGFSIDDAKSFVETENIGFSIHKMLTNKETFDSIADVVTALNPS